MLDKNSNVYDIIIIGAGCTGYAAAMYCGRFEMKTLVLGEVIGGTIILTDNVENYPGFKRLTGQELADKLREHALDYKNVEIKNDRVEKIEKNDKLFNVYTKKNKYCAKTIIVATGTKVKKLEVPGEYEFTNKGVHYCALCDGPFYKNKIVGVVGGSDSAAKEALLLTQYAKIVYIIYRGEKIHPEPINEERVYSNKKIEIINNTNIKEIKGNKVMTHIILDRLYKGNKELKIDGLFVEIGHIPISDFVKPLKVKLNDKNEIIIDRTSSTNIPGIFAAGDVVDTRFKQAITGVGEGVSAAYSAYQYINENQLA